MGRIESLQKLMHNTNKKGSTIAVASRKMAF